MEYIQYLQQLFQIIHILIKTIYQMQFICGNYTIEAILKKVYLVSIMQ